METYKLTVSLNKIGIGFYTIARKDNLSLDQLQSLLLEYTNEYPNFYMLDFAITENESLRSY